LIVHPKTDQLTSYDLSAGCIWRSMSDEVKCFSWFFIHV